MILISMRHACVRVPGARLLRNFSTHRPELVFTECLTGEFEGITSLCMNRQDKRNALGKEFTHQFKQQIDQLSAMENEIRVLILRSLVPNIFCAGADLKERLAMSEQEVPQMSHMYRTVFSQLHALPFPTIAAIDGHALGGGLEMALACDLRIAASSVRIGLVETSLAIIPGAGGSQRLPRLIGVSKAKELIFTAKVLNGREAHEIGLVNEAVDQTSGGDAAFRRCLEIGKVIARNGPIGVRAAKEAINRGSEEPDLHRALEIEGECYQKVVATRDRIEGLKAFADKRTPQYRGE
jgi:methylglutaconyl-CoA hydratase